MCPNPSTLSVFFPILSRKPLSVRQIIIPAEKHRIDIPLHGTRLTLEYIQSSLRLNVKLFDIYH